MFVVSTPDIKILENWKRKAEEGSRHIYYLKHKDKILSANSEYRQNNPDYYREYTKVSDEMNELPISEKQRKAEGVPRRIQTTEQGNTKSILPPN